MAGFQILLHVLVLLMVTGLCVNAYPRYNPAVESFLGRISTALARGEEVGTLTSGQWRGR